MSLKPKNLPEALAAQAQGAWENILERAGKTLGRELCDAFAGAPLAQQLPRVLACSPFVAEQARRKQPPGYDRRCRDLSPEERCRLEAELDREGRKPVVRFRTPSA